MHENMNAERHAKDRFATGDQSCPIRWEKKNDILKPPRWKSFRVYLYFLILLYMRVCIISGCTFACMCKFLCVSLWETCWVSPPRSWAYQIQAEQIKARRSCFHIREAALPCGLISFIYTVGWDTHTHTKHTRASSMLGQTKMCIILIHPNARSVTQMWELS